jgi:hypothetical protein
MELFMNGAVFWTVTPYSLAGVYHVPEVCTAYTSELKSKPSKQCREEDATHDSLYTLELHS